VGTTVQQLADLVQGQVHGDGNQDIAAAGPIRRAEPGHISFVENERNIRHLSGYRASAIVVPRDLLGRKADMETAAGRPLTLLAVQDALAAFVAIVQHLHGQEPATHFGLDWRAAVDPTAKIGAETDIHPFAVIGPNSTVGARCTIHSGAVVGRDCRIGDDVVIYPNAVLYHGTVVGNRVIIHANTVLGADGFGYRFHAGQHQKIPQLGSVELEDDVEIGACTTIDRGTFDVTRIGRGTKIDNLVQIGHNCRIGNHNLIVSQVGIAGSSSTGDYVVLAGQVGITDHVHIGDGTQIGAKAGITRDHGPGERLLGAPARPERDAKRILLSLDRLPDLVKDVAAIKKQLAAMATDDKKPTNDAA
jgi:UDP-3-O-[3-hydroxymyristoyl] glucosamine N-acyltransferase